MISSFEVVSKSIQAFESRRSTLVPMIRDPEISSIYYNQLNSIQNFDWNVSDFDFDAAKAMGQEQATEESNFRVFIALLVVSAAILGLLVNVFILLLSYFHVHGDYRHFVANLAVIDIVGGKENLIFEI